VVTFDHRSTSEPVRVGQGLLGFAIAAGDGRDRSSWCRCHPAGQDADSPSPPLGAELTASTSCGRRPSRSPPSCPRHRRSSHRPGRHGSFWGQAAATTRAPTPPWCRPRWPTSETRHKRCPGGAIAWGGDRAACRGKVGRNRASIVTSCLRPRDADHTR
jgi:hypothetical protein